jgi:hypothetical protein
LPLPVLAKSVIQNGKEVLQWQVSKDDIRIWKNSHWYKEKLGRYYYGYGDPVLSPTSAKN